MRLRQETGVKCYNVLTGFKWIAELIKEKEGKENYVSGGEESYGLMIGSIRSGIKMQLALLPFFAKWLLMKKTREKPYLKN